MAEKKFLEDVYGVQSAAATRQLYDDWSASYETEIAEAGYATPMRIAEALARHATNAAMPILDFGCGTGLSGLALRQRGYSVVDGADLSAEMLVKAREKRAYRRIWQVNPDDTIPDGYGAVSAAGVIGSGAAPVTVIDKVMVALPVGGFFALSFNDHTLEDPQFEARLRSYITSGQARLLFQEYGTHLPGIGMKSNVYLLEKT